MALVTSLIRCNQLRIIFDCYSADVSFNDGTSVHTQWHTECVRGGGGGGGGERRGGERGEVMSSDTGTRPVTFDIVASFVTVLGIPFPSISSFDIFSLSRCFIHPPTDEGTHWHTDTLSHTPNRTRRIWINNVLTPNPTQPNPLLPSLKRNMQHPINIFKNPKESRSVRGGGAVHGLSQWENKTVRIRVSRTARNRQKEPNEKVTWELRKRTNKIIMIMLNKRGGGEWRRRTS